MERSNWSLTITIFTVKIFSHWERSNDPFLLLLKNTIRKFNFLENFLYRSSRRLSHSWHGTVIELVSIHKFWHYQIWGRDPSATNLYLVYILLPPKQTTFISPGFSYFLQANDSAIKAEHPSKFSNFTKKLGRLNHAR